MSSVVRWSCGAIVSICERQSPSHRDRYNLVLRASSDTCPPFMKADFEATCRGNKYVTTLHVLNSCIIKLSKLTVVRKVYRGLARGVLPSAFWKADMYAVRGGVETAFMSTTSDRSVAVSYADGGSSALVLELEQVTLTPDQPSHTLPSHFYNPPYPGLNLGSFTNRAW